MKRVDCILSNVSKGKAEKISLKIADTAISHMRGLMFRKKIIPILFIFERDGIYPIHSNFVCAPFDAVYASSEKKALEIYRKIPPNTQLVKPKKPARFLLELPPELFDGLGISEGDALSWEWEEKKKQDAPRLSFGKFNIALGIRKTEAEEKKETNEADDGIQTI